MKLNKNEKGFSAVEFIMIIVIIALIGTVGYLTYKNHHNTATAMVSVSKTNAKPTQSTAGETAITASTYSGWNQYCSKPIGACFNYPKDWSLDLCPNPPRVWQSGCDLDGGVLTSADKTVVMDFDVQSTSTTNFSNCNPESNFLIPGLTYSDITKLSGASNLYYVKLYETAPLFIGGYWTTLALLNGNNGQPPAVGKTGSLCPD